MCVCVCVCVCLCMYVCMYVCMHVCMYMYVRMPISKAGSVRSRPKRITRQKIPSPVDGFLVLMDVSYQLSFWSPPG